MSKETMTATQARAADRDKLVRDIMAAVTNVVHVPVKDRPVIRDEIMSIMRKAKEKRQSWA